jgi:hypothetical protein
MLACIEVWNYTDTSMANGRLYSTTIKNAASLSSGKHLMTFMPGRPLLSFQLYIYRPYWQHQTA